MKNVIVFALGGARYAVELRWVREVTKLGPVTPVPGGPAAASSSSSSSSPSPRPADRPPPPAPCAGRAISA